MGARKLRRWLSGPLRVKSEIENRLDCVQGFLEQDLLSDKIRTSLSKVGDLERIMTRISLPIASLADVVRLRESLEPLAELASLFQSLENTSLFEKVSGFDPLVDLCELLRSQILPTFRTASGTRQLLFPFILHFEMASFHLQNRKS